MIGDILPPLVAAAAIALTYFFCMRPMLKGQGCHMMLKQAGKSSCHSGADTENATQVSATDDTDAGIARLREEVQLLRYEAGLRATSGKASEPPVYLDKSDPR